MSDLDPSTAPEITLCGKTYKLPELELKQIIPLTARLLKLRNASFSDLSEEELRALFDIAYIALAFVEPTVTREQFDRSPPTFIELMAAFPAILRQGRFPTAASGETNAGE